MFQQENEVLLPPYVSFKVLHVAHNVVRDSRIYTKYAKLQCLGINEKLKQVVVPAKQKKKEKLMQAVETLKAFNNPTLVEILQGSLSKLVAIIDQQTKELASWIKG